MQHSIANKINNNHSSNTNSENSRVLVNNNFYISENSHKYISAGINTKNLHYRRCVIQNSNASRESYGGKGSSLKLLQNIGIPVPEFELISIDKINSLMDHNLDLAILKKSFSNINFDKLPQYSITTIKKYVSYLDDKNLQRSILNDLTQFICSNEFYQQIKNTAAAHHIRLKYNDLLSIFQVDIPVIVRSSSIAEDNYGDAQAGKYESIVHKHQDILQTCLEVIASSFQPEICMLAPKPISLIVQLCVDCSVGGVAMSYSSLQDDSIRVEYTLGQPKNVVAGQYGVTAHSYSINRTGSFKAQFNIGDIKSYYSLEKNSTSGGYTEQLQSLTNISQKQELDKYILVSLKTYLETLEDIFVCPVDVEFAIDKNNKLFILQVRPITKLSGGVDFTLAAPKEALTSGVLISEGFCAGTLVKFNPTCDLSTIPPGAIIYSEHGNDKMLEHDFLQHVGGFIFKYGGLNDHVAITLRQASKPCIVTKHKFAITDYNNTPITIACGNFNKISGAYVIKGDFTQKLQSASIATNSLANYQLKNPELLEKKEINFNRPDTAFKWLNVQNYYLLNYFAPDRLINICLVAKNPLQFAMSANRVNLVKTLKLEITSLLSNLELLLEGYRCFLSIGNNSETFLEEKSNSLLTTKFKKYQQIKSIYNCLASNIQVLIDDINDDLTLEKNNVTNSITFTKWLNNCKTLLNHIQQLNNPLITSDIKTIHDIIFWIHKEFVTCLPVVAIASKMGRIQIIDADEAEDKAKAEAKILVIDFNPVELANENLLNESCIQVLIDNAKKTTVVEISGAAYINVELGVHVCVIEMLEQAEANKGRLLRIKLSDDFNDEYHFAGKLKRFWLFQQILRTIAQEQETTEFNCLINPTTGTITVEFSYIESKDIMQQTFIKLIAALHWTIGLDTYIYKQPLFKELVEWDFPFLENLINNSTAEDIEDNFIYALLYSSYLSDEALPFLAEKHKKWDVAFHEILKLHSRTAITAALDKFPEREKLVYYLFLFKPHIYRHLIKNNDWKTDKNIAANLVYKNVAIFQYLSDELRNDESFFRLLVIHNSKVFEYISKELVNNKQLFLDFLPQNGDYVKFASDELKDDLDISLLAVKCGKEAIKYLSPDKKRNLQVITKSLKYNPLSMKYVDPAIRKEHINLVIDTVTKYGCVLALLDEEIQENLNVLIPALISAPYMYKCISKKLQDNEQITFLAISLNGIYYNYASERLRNKLYLFNLAIENNGMALKGVAKEEFKTADNVLLAIKNNGRALEFAPEEYRKNPAYVLEAINQDINAIEHADYEIRNNFDFMAPIVAKQGNLLKYAGDDCRNNLKLVKSAIMNNPYAIKFASDEVKQQLEYATL